MRLQYTMLQESKFVHVVEMSLTGSSRKLGIHRDGYTIILISIYYMYKVL